MNLVFDFGRVLLRWRPAALVQRVLPGRAATEEQAAHWASLIFQAYSGDWGEFDRGTVTEVELVQRIARRTGLARFEVQAVVDAGPAELAPLPDSMALLARLRADSTRLGRKLFYLSNMPDPYARHLERTHDFVRSFDDGVFSSRVQLIKPEPAIFALAAQRFGVPPAQLLFIDDHAPNVQAAKDSGWQAIHFIDAAQCAEDLRGLGWWPEPQAPTTTSTPQPPQEPNA